MSKLLNADFKIKFDKIEKNAIPNLPADLQNAANIIINWKEGADNFSIKTSGSTGKPKEIWLKRHLMEKSAHLTGKTFGISAGDTLFCCLSTESIAGMMMVIRALVLDCDLYVTAPSNNPLKNVPENTKLDFAAFVPMQMQQLISESLDKISLLNDMKAIILGGAPVSWPFLKSLSDAEIKCPVYHTYGMTETYTHVAIRLLNGEKGASDYYSPLEGVKLSLDDRNCLVIESEITEGQKLVTNDVVELNKDDSFRWLGRFDNVIISGGVKIQAEEVERAAEILLAGKGKTGIRLFAASLPDEKLGQKLVLVIEDELCPENKKTDFFNALKKQLPKYHAPKELFFISKFKETASGKIDRISIVKEIAQ